MDRKGREQKERKTERWNEKDDKRETERGDR